MKRQSNTVDPDLNPLNAVAAPDKKTRFAKSEPLRGPKKAKTLSLKAQEKALASAPVKVNAEEKATDKVQSSALGLNGDTGKKKKAKTKKVKGQPAPAKERIQEKQAPPPPAQPAPTVNPNIGAPIQGAGTTPSATAPASK